MVCIEGSARIWVTRSNPLNAGMSTSEITRSGRDPASRSMACWADCAVSTTWPAVRRAARTDSSVAGSSSTTSTR
jgi:hypothetical protein